MSTLLGFSWPNLAMFSALFGLTHPFSALLSLVQPYSALLSRTYLSKMFSLSFMNGVSKVNLVKWKVSKRVLKNFTDMYVVIKPEFSKFPKKIKVRSLSSSRCKFSQVQTSYLRRKVGGRCSCLLLKNQRRSLQVMMFIDEAWWNF